MSEAVIVALITGACAIVGQLIIAGKSRAEMSSHLDRQQAVMQTRLEDLTREVREHKGFARRLPVIEEQIKVANHRIDDLEKRAG